MRIFHAIVIMVPFICAVACAPVNTKLMYNPMTCDVKECKRDPLKNWRWEEEAVLKKCVDEYKKLGFIEADESKVKSSPCLPKQSSETTLSDKLLELRAARDKGLITEQEYEEQRSIILEKFSQDVILGTPR